MKKISFKIKLAIILATLYLLLCVGIVFFVSGLFKYNHKAVCKGEYIWLDGVEYEECGGYYFDTKEYLCRVDGWKLYSIEYDDELNYFVALGGFTANRLYVRTDYERTHDEVTGIIIEGKTHDLHNDKELIDFFCIDYDKIIAEAPQNVDTKEYKRKSIYLQYDNRPVVGLLCKLAYDAKEKIYVIMLWEDEQYYNYVVPEEYNALLDKFYN